MRYSLALLLLAGGAHSVPPPNDDRARYGFSMALPTDDVRFFPDAVGLWWIGSKNSFGLEFEAYIESKGFVCICGSRFCGVPGVDCVEGEPLRWPEKPVGLATIPTPDKTSAMSSLVWQFQPWEGKKGVRPMLFTQARLGRFSQSVTWRMFDIIGGVGIEWRPLDWVGLCARQGARMRFEWQNRRDFDLGVGPIEVRAFVAL